MVGSYCHLSLAERRALFQLREAQQPVGMIAAALGRHRSTIYRELRRNFFRGDSREWNGYFPVTAQSFARSRSRRRRLAKLAMRPDLRDYVSEQLEAGWSPQQIAGRLGRPGGGPGTVCHETIYRFIYGPEGRQRELYRCLAKARRRRGHRHGRKPRSNPIPMSRWIGSRPEDVAPRKVFGHWECDLVIFGKQSGKQNVTTLLERMSRYTVLLPNVDRRSAAVIGGIEVILAPFPPSARRTITFDRGTEFLSYPALAQSLSVASYFCDPHSPWQKGAVENANGRIRRFLPTDVSPDAITGPLLDDLTRRLNDTPRRCLGYQTPEEVFRANLASLSAPA
jgi:IS30 family transposase